MERDCDGETAPALSLTVTLNLKVPGASGMPLIAPFPGSRLRPLGSAPVTTAQVLYGGEPLPAASVAEYAVATVPFGNKVVFTMGRATSEMGTDLETPL